MFAAPAWLQAVADIIGVAELVDHAALEPLDPALRGADVAVNLHGRGPQSTALLVASGAARVVAFGGGGGGGGGPRFDADEHEVRRWCRLLTECGIPADPGDLFLDAPAMPSAAPGATVVHVGASTPEKRWPVERWAEVVRAELARGRRVVVTGNDAERALAERVADLAGLEEGDVLAGRLDLGRLVATVAGAGRVLSGDTGVAHLATAYRRPSVVLFGVVPPSRWGPPPDGPHQVVWADGAPLSAISVEDVLSAIGRLG